MNNTDSKTRTLNICPRWIDIIDMMLWTWKDGDLDHQQRKDLKEEFHKLAKAGDEKMKEFKQGPYAKGGRYYEEDE